MKELDQIRLSKIILISMEKKINLFPFKAMEKLAIKTVRLAQISLNQMSKRKKYLTLKKESRLQIYSTTFMVLCESRLRHIQKREEKERKLSAPISNPLHKKFKKFKKNFD